MKTNKIKKYILYVSLVGSLFLVILFNKGLWDLLIDMSRQNENSQIIDTIETVLMYLYLFPPLFLISLTTYKMKDEVFTAWIKFATWWVPVIILVTYLQSTQSGGGGLGIGGVLSSGFDALVLGFFYFIFILVSLVIIVKKYTATR